VVDVPRFSDWSTRAKLVVVLIVGILVGSALSSLGDPGQGSDPAGTSTGDETSTLDGGSPSTSPATAPEDSTNATVTDVVDGDTIKTRFHGDIITVRLIGVDSPEVAGPYTSTECFGPRASQFATKVLDGQRVRLEFDVDELDRFGRTLAYVWLGDRLFNEQLVSEGFATVATFPPNVAYIDRFRSAQREARAHDRGLWGQCDPGPFQVPGLVGGTGNGGTGGGGGGNCDASYPGVCIAPYPPDLDCADVPFTNFQVKPPDPHGFDGDYDGVGCET
jgi:micrococcal nuclease